VTDGQLAALQVHVLPSQREQLALPQSGPECGDVQRLQPWSVEVVGFTGLFKGGRAAADVFAAACGAFDCGFDEAQASVKLR
jgi:hypothetical protein